MTHPSAVGVYHVDLPEGSATEYVGYLIVARRGGRPIVKSKMLPNIVAAAIEMKRLEAAGTVGPLVLAEVTAIAQQNDRGDLV